MEEIPFMVFSVFAILAIASLFVIVYLIAKRLDDKKRENFEKRDN